MGQDTPSGLGFTPSPQPLPKHCHIVRSGGARASPGEFWGHDSAPNKPCSHTVTQKCLGTPGDEKRGHLPTRRDRRGPARAPARGHRAERGGAPTPPRCSDLHASHRRRASAPLRVSVGRLCKHALNIMKPLKCQAASHIRVLRACPGRGTHEAPAPGWRPGSLARMSPSPGPRHPCPSPCPCDAPPASLRALCS